MVWQAEVINRTASELHSVEEITQCDDIQVIPSLRQGGSGKLLGVLCESDDTAVKTFFVPEDGLNEYPDDTPDVWLHDVTPAGKTKILRTFKLIDDSMATVTIKHIPESE